MGGRSGFGSKGLSSVQKSVENSSMWKETKKYYSGKSGKIKTSEYFMSGLKDSIGKAAFMQGKEITTKQVDKIASNMLTKLG